MADPLDGIPLHLRGQVHADEYGYWNGRLTVQEREQYLAGLQAKYDADKPRESSNPMDGVIPSLRARATKPKPSDPEVERNAKAQEEANEILRQAADKQIQHDKEREKPKGVELSRLIKAVEAEEQRNPDAPKPDLQSLEKQLRQISGSESFEKVLDKVQRQLRELTEPDRKLADSVRQLVERMQEDQRKSAQQLAESLKPPKIDWAKLGETSIRPIDDYAPDWAEFGKQESERREAEERARIAGMETAFDRALKNAEQRAESSHKARDTIKRLGFTPLDELPSEPSPKSGSFKHKVIGLVEAVAGVGVAVGGSQIERISLSLIVIALGWALITASVWKLNLLEGKALRSQRMFNTSLTCLGAVALLFLWWAGRPEPKPPPLTAKEIQEAVRSALPSPSPTIPLIERVSATLNGIPLKAHGIAGLDELMSAAGYNGSTAMSVLIIVSNETDKIKVELAAGRWVDSTRVSGRVYHILHGYDTREILIFSEKEATIDLAYTPLEPK